MLGRHVRCHGDALNGHRLGGAAFLGAALLSGSTALASAVDPPAAPGQVATWYAPAAAGLACLATTLPTDRYTVAVGPAMFRDSAACNGYLEISGARGTILAKIDNLCPECGANHVDLSTEAFAALDDPGRGRVPVRFRAVTDPPIDTDVVLTCKDGSSVHWLGLHVDDTGNAVASVVLSSPGRAARRMTRSTNGFWVDDQAPGPGPFSVTITDVLGRTVTATDVRLAVGVPQHTGLRLY